MSGLLIKILVLVLAVFGIFKMFPQLGSRLDYYYKDPVLQTQVVAPVTQIANRILPAKLQLPTPAVMGATTDGQISSPIKELTDTISKQAANLAADQIVSIKKTATDQFCQVLIEKIKTECGQTTPTPSPASK